jgi:hypothetical protein
MRINENIACHSTLVIRSLITLCRCIADFPHLGAQEKEERKQKIPETDRQKIGGNRRMHGVPLTHQSLSCFLIN